MGKNKKNKKKSVIPTYAFGITWLICMVFLRMSFGKCLIIAYVVSWLVKTYLRDRADKQEEKQEPVKATPVRKPEPKPESEKTSGNPELDAVIRDGRKSVARIQQLNDDIPDFKISAQLKQIEILTASIIDQVEKKPDKLKEVRQFMNYYLPTTIKLLEEYVQMQDVGLKGENITAGMQQIEAMLDKVIVAFQKQLDSLFERDVVDITAEIQVMEQMMAAQGLTNNKDF